VVRVVAVLQGGATSTRHEANHQRIVRAFSPAAHD
jgi:hypothetical protein